MRANAEDRMLRKKKRQDIKLHFFADCISANPDRYAKEKKSGKTHVKMTSDFEL